MKKLGLLITSMFMVVAFISCEKRNVEIVYAPVSSDFGIIAVPMSGNQDCDDIDGNYIGSTGRINYVNGFFDGNWPEGFTVTVTDDKYVSFEIDPTIFPYCIGAVIVKGGNAANVYYYDPGVLTDQGLVSPINSSGKPADLSNLTFCFVECKDLVIALKTHYQNTDGEYWAVTIGNGSDNESRGMGYIEFDYNATNSYKIYNSGRITRPVGTLSISNFINKNDGIHYLMIELTGDFTDMSFYDTYLYVGTVDGYLDYQSLLPDGITLITNYKGFPFIDLALEPVKTFIIPFSEITE